MRANEKRSAKTRNHRAARLCLIRNACEMSGKLRSDVAIVIGSATVLASGQSLIVAEDLLFLATQEFQSRLPVQPRQPLLDRVGASRRIRRRLDADAPRPNLSQRHCRCELPTRGRQAIYGCQSCQLTHYRLLQSLSPRGRNEIPMCPCSLRCE